jgi:Flp pilus assembly protein TadB
VWKRRREAARLQLIEIAETLAASLRAGRSVHGALAQLPPHLTGRFRTRLLALQQRGRGSALPAGPLRWIPSTCPAREEFAAVVVAMEASRQCHADLAAVLSSLARAMRQRYVRPGAAGQL